MYILIIIIPLIGCILSGLFGRYFGREGSALLSTLGIFITFMISIFGFYEIAICNTIISIKIYN
jgi:NADH:ubiquinone oxidoreductase subunit 5 (subunit L)/multisubunit Na+/H+ antiporter MnhA subunit